MTYKGQGPSVVCFSSTNLAGHIAHKNSKEDAVYIFLAKLRIICELAIIYSRIFLGSVGKSHVESGCCFFCLCSCSPTGHDFVTVFVAKLRTSSRLLAWRFNTLQVYDLPGIFVHVYLLQYDIANLLHSFIFVCVHVPLRGTILLRSLSPSCAPLRGCLHGVSTHCRSTTYLAFSMPFSMAILPVVPMAFNVALKAHVVR